MQLQGSVPAESGTDDRWKKVKHHKHAGQELQTHTSDIDAYFVAVMSMDLLFVNIKLVFKMPSGSIQLKRKRL